MSKYGIEGLKERSFSTLNKKNNVVLVVRWRFKRR
jgi:hypothetical protein